MIPFLYTKAGPAWIQCPCFACPLGLLCPSVLCPGPMCPTWSLFCVTHVLSVPRASLL